MCSSRIFLALVFSHPPCLPQTLHRETSLSIAAPRQPNLSARCAPSPILVGPSPLTHPGAPDPPRSCAALPGCPGSLGWAGGCSRRAVGRPEPTLWVCWLVPSLRAPQPALPSSHQRWGGCGCHGLCWHSRCRDTEGMPRELAPCSCSAGCPSTWAISSAEGAGECTPSLLSSPFCSWHRHRAARCCPGQPT